MPEQVQVKRGPGRPAVLTKNKRDWSKSGQMIRASDSVRAAVRQVQAAFEAETGGFLSQFKSLDRIIERAGFPLIQPTPVVPKV